jgi:3-methyladenine DNA glycosylase AlkD
MNLQDALNELEALGNEKRRAHNTKYGAGDNQFGVKMGDIRKLAKTIKTNHDLAMELWATNIVDARFLAILILKPKLLSTEEIDRMVRSVTFVQVADWLNSYVIKHHPDKEALRQTWMTDNDPMAARAGWNLTDQLVKKNPDKLDIPMLLNRIESEMGNAASEVQWTMNNSLVSIGIYHADYRDQALSIGETLGVYRDYPVVKGCTSPFAPIWIEEMVSRQS